MVKHITEKSAAEKVASMKGLHDYSDMYGLIMQPLYSYSVNFNDIIYSILLSVK